MPQIIVCEWRVIFSENLLHKTVYPLKDPCLLQSYHLSRSIIDIAKEICSGGFPKAYSIDVKIEER